MKKLLILQIEGYALGGIWFVNKTLSEGLIDYNIETVILSVRNAPLKSDLKIDSRVKMYTINEKDPWTITRRGEVIKSFLKLSNNSFSLLKKRFDDTKKLKFDYLKVKEFIKEYNPDYIITSHYQLLDSIPKDYLKKTFHVQHTSFYATKMVPDNIRLLFKYRNKVKYVWLSKSTCLEAANFFPNSTYIYNPIRFKDDIKNDVLKNKKLIVVTRISKEKRIDLMIDIVKNIFEDSKFIDWTFEIYGNGDISLITDKIDNKQIFYKGETDNPIKVLSKASINLNTSSFEGFSLSIIEAAYCSLPTVTFNFGESVFEEIINNKTGIIVDMDNIDEYKNKLIKLMENEKLLSKLSNGAKKFSKKFEIDNYLQEWLKLFNQINQK